MTGLRLAARYARLLLVLGLVGGFALPELAQAMKPALPALVAFLVFVSALRIGLRAALGSLHEARRSVGLVLAFQLAVPLALVALLLPFAPAGGYAAVAAVLAMSAPSISGSPAFTVMLGHDPAPAMRLFILGTALLPLTVIPVFWLVPALGGPGEVIAAALRLTAVIGLAAGAAFALRRLVFPDPGAETVQALDGLAAVTLAVIVVGLMSAVGPVLRTDPAALAGWLALAFAVNFGMQIAARACGAPVAASVIAGNRNIALFLVALPASVTDPVLVFIGCYQVPMYLTPILMQRFYGPPR
ncbi:MAG: hypothetical protein QNJ44_00630 [Rhodobacter sp.]|nr:hypothetical protein [Rhodobacter sp.]